MFMKTVCTILFISILTGCNSSSVDVNFGSEARKEQSLNIALNELSQNISSDEGQDISIDVNNSLDGSDVFGSENITYSCYYDQTIDGTVASLQNCHSQIGSFDSSTGSLNWSPDYFSAGNYEIKIIASSGTQSDEVIFTVAITDQGNGCPENFVRVPSDNNYVSEDFCVAKFEMKNDGSGNAVSQASGTPWWSINHASMISACQTMGAGYDLITNAQWQVLARNIELVSENWIGGVIGSGQLFVGHSDSSPGSGLSVSDENDPYDQTGDSTGSNPEQKRTHTLSTGEIIWDVGGNMAERTKDSQNVNLGSHSYITLLTDLSHTTTDVFEDGVIRNAKGHFGTTNDYTTTLNTAPHGGIGRALLNFNADSFMRGGRYNQGADNAGVFMVDLNEESTHTHSYLGFRCVFMP